MPLKNIYSGVTAGAEAITLSSLFKSRPVLYICATEAKAQQLKEQFTHVAPFLNLLYFPAWDCLPYDRVSAGLDVMAQRIDILTTLSEARQPYCVIMSVAAFLQKLPPKDVLQKQVLTLTSGQALSQGQLIGYLSERGYIRTETVREAGEYAVRGGIIDLFPPGSDLPIRVDFFGDEIEQLRSFDVMTQISSASLPETVLKPVNELTLQPEVISHFRTHYRELFGAVNDPLYQSVSQGRKYAGMEHWLPLFFPQCDTVPDYMDNADIYMEEGCEAAVHSRLQVIQDYYQARLTALLASLKGIEKTTYRPLPPDLLYWTSPEWEHFLHGNPWAKVTPFQPNNASGDTILTDFKARPLIPFTASSPDRPETFSLLSTCLATAKNNHKPVILACFSEGSQDRMLAILEEHLVTGVNCLTAWPPALESLKGKEVSIVVYPLEQGFELPDLLVISEQDLLGDRVARAKPKRRKSGQFFLEAAHLTAGDLVVHRDHGIGRYEGLMAIKVGEAAHDCLNLVYEGGDKLFLPVENIEMVTRYGSDGAAAQLDRLGSAAWQMRKAKVKKRIREVADYLIKIAAERALQEGVILERHPAHYEEFCARFPYMETDDQQRAIEEVLGDMASGKPMDRLVCGDVGFGKTEVALRAAFVAVSQGKQVALVVPTTLLCRQHFQTFQERFRGFPYRVDQLSRFVTPVQAEKTRLDMEAGEVSIVIATHALLSDKIRFKDLGLLIVDEEHHFGVKQKEKLKSLATDVHVLTLTATPIPRTLQMALSGVRELSLITTPPVDRLAVRTFVMPYDPIVIREAILREYYRGGQIFCVSPRLEDLGKWHESLKDLIPEIRIATAHGQMSAPQLEAVMNAFYDRAYDLLLSTNIIESGIDIATANTLIINRADMFGLAQLYQLRGRVGRGKTQGYAYLTLPEGKVIPPASVKRLEVMQTLDNLGVGFNLASHDMDIRGTGNLVGEEQSGHIREVGVELYQHLLQEMILIVRAEQELGKTPDFEWVPQINLGASVLIPEIYVADLSLRLGLYRRISALENRNQIDVFAAEMINRFGPLPVEVSNLFDLIEIKGLCRQAGIEKLDVGPRGALVTFHTSKVPDIDSLLGFINLQKGAAKLRPDQKLVFIRPWNSLSARVKGAKQVCRALASL